MINGSNVNIVSQGIGKPEEREGDGGTTGRWGGKTHESIVHVCHLVWAWFVVPQHYYKSHIKDHRSLITIKNIVTKKFEIW